VVRHRRDEVELSQEDDPQKSPHRRPAPLARAGGRPAQTSDARLDSKATLPTTGDKGISPITPASPNHFVQVHIWLRRDDVTLVKQAALDRDQTVSALIRSLVGTLRRQLTADEGPTTST